LFLGFPKEVYYFAPTEFVTFGSKEHKDTVNLRLGLIAFAACGMVKKSLGDRIL